MDLELKDKVAVVTGGSEGIGKAIALGLAREGARVAICARRDDVLQKTADEIRNETDSEVLASVVDMCEQAEIDRFIAEVVERWGTVHVVVNNMGMAKKALFEELTREDWDRTLEGNLFSTIQCTRNVLPHMRKQKWGRVINISAVSGREPSPMLMASNVAKSGMISFSKTLAAEVAGDNILVNCICPGRILTPQILRLFNEEQRASIATAQIPLQRFGEAEELANLAVFLASERASYLTGTTIPVDGGIVRALY
jgi:NAD(P)-dependent dehydrogenase (short-subunit alcohol dehydrogenase family)